MQSQPSNTRVRRDSKSLKHKKCNPNVPKELDVHLYLPESVGSVANYEWTPAPEPESVAVSVFRMAVTEPLAERLSGTLANGGAR
jgi:hypothetical protein